jgi:small subunit ribosomal protein S6
MMLRTYETVFVTNPDASQETFDVIDSKLKGFIKSSGGELGHEETWGVRNLSFPIKKQDKGKYSYMLYSANPEIIKEMEFYLKISEPVLTFLTVKVKDTVDFENVPKPNSKDLL